MPINETNCDSERLGTPDRHLTCLGPSFPPPARLMAFRLRLVVELIMSETHFSCAVFIWLSEGDVICMSGHLGAVAGIRRKGLSDGLTLTRWRNAIFRVAGATN